MSGGDLIELGEAGDIVILGFRRHKRKEIKEE
jgi:hypothetical protein